MACLLGVVISVVLGIKLSLTEAIISKTGLAQIEAKRRAIKCRLNME